MQVLHFTVSQAKFQFLEWNFSAASDNDTMGERPQRDYCLNICVTNTSIDWLTAVHDVTSRVSVSIRGWLQDTASDFVSLGAAFFVCMFKTRICGSWMHSLWCIRSKSFCSCLILFQGIEFSICVIKNHWSHVGSGSRFWPGWEHITVACLVLKN